MPHYAWSSTLATCLVFFFTHHPSITSFLIHVSIRLCKYSCCNCMYFCYNCSLPPLFILSLQSHSLLPISVSLMHLLVFASTHIVDAYSHHHLYKYRLCNCCPHLPQKVLSLQSLFIASTCTTIEIVHLSPLQVPSLKSLLIRLYKYHCCNRLLTSSTTRTSRFN